MKSKKTLCIVILTVVCVGLMVLTGFLIAKTLHPGPSMPADTSKPSEEVNLKWETAFIEDTPTDMDIPVNTAPLGGTATGDTPEKPRVQVSFSGGESDVVGDMPSVEIPLGLYTIPEPAYRHSGGRTFGGWHCSLDNGIYYPDELLVVTDAQTPVVLTAVWQAPKFCVTLVEGTDQSNRSTVTVEEGGTYTLPDAEPPEGYRFVGWQQDQKDVLCMEGDTVTVMEDTVLTAIYDPIFYTVSFSSDGGTGTVDSIRVRHGDTVQIPEISYTRQYYKSIGWLLNGRLIMPGTFMEVKEDLHLICGWALKTSETWTGTNLTVSYSSLYTINVSKHLNVEELARAGYSGYRIKLTQVTSRTEGRCRPGVEVYSDEPQTSYFGVDNWQMATYKKTNRVIDSDLVYDQTQVFYSETLSLDKLLSSGSKLYIYEKARAAYPLDVGKNSMLITITLEVEVF